MGRFNKLTLLTNQDGDWYWPSDDAVAWPAICDEAKVIDAVRSVARASNVDRDGVSTRILQAGGNAGMMPILLGRGSGLSSKEPIHVLTYEPFWPNYTALIANIDERASNVTPIFGALWHEAQWVKMEAEQKERFNYGAWYAATVPEHVETGIPGHDSLAVMDFYKPHLIWLDTEGSEPVILQRAAPFLREFQPTVIIEKKGLGERYGYTDARTDELFAGLGYEFCLTFGRDFMYAPRKRFDVVREAFASHSKR